VARCSWDNLIFSSPRRRLPWRPTVRLTVSDLVGAAIGENTGAST
jgi:hypothetical protein